MANLQMTNSLSQTFHKAGLQLKKHSPEILIVAGVVGVVASTILACRATTKVDSVMKSTKKKVEAIHKGMKDGEINGEKYTEEDGKKDLTIVYAKTGLEFVKLYAPAVILGTLSLTSIVASNNILRKRNVALAAAYATVDKGFKAYRKRVVDRFGENVDRELRFNIKSKEVEENIVDDDGNVTTVKKTINVIDENDPNQWSEYARIFDETCPGWDREPDYNRQFLILRQNEANEKLKARGHLFLNEVYDMLGFPRSKAGQVVGWVYDNNNPKAAGDNYVDFGIFDVHRERARAFMNGYEKSIILDFNVDGNIWELMH